MITPPDRRGYERVAVLNEQAYEAHRPSHGFLRRAEVANYPQSHNLAAEAQARVDSFYGTVNTDQVSDLYPVLNQVAVEWSPGPWPGFVYLRLATVTPEFSGFQWRFDGGPWESGCQTSLSWLLHRGPNEVAVRAINSAGHMGRASRLCLSYESDGDMPWPESVKLTSLDNGAAVPLRTPFGWEEFDRPQLRTLRQWYGLDEVISKAASDLERVVRLRDWVKSRWDHEQPITSPPWDALYMLERVEKGIEAFYCVHYSVAFMQCCLSLGIPARLVNLHQGIAPADFDRRRAVFEPPDLPVFEHVVNEVWLDDLGRWVMMDVDFDIHYERGGVPLSALEIHQVLLADELGTLQVREGLLAHKLKKDETDYQLHLPTYYAHFSVFWRNDHLSDPKGPTRILHWIDDSTPPILWWEGSDLRHRPQIIGPAIVAWPYTDTTPRLTDGNVDTCWASSEEPVPHWVELHWPGPVTLSQVVVDWAECWRRYWTSTRYRLQVRQDGEWHDVLEVTDNRETACNRHSFSTVQADGLRLWQPVGGGPSERPHLLWLAEIEVYE